jgi:pimeloyl-ACP methyl ester carboxylesterase
MRADGFTEEQVQQAMTDVAWLLDAVRRQEPFEHIQPVLREMMDQPWHRYLPIDEADVRASLQVDQEDFFGYDPVPILQRVMCPVLAIFGERDLYLPVDKSVTAFQTALAIGTSGSCDHTTCNLRWT